MKTRVGAIVALAGLLVGPAHSNAQVGRVGGAEMECREGVPQGDLGITGLDCRGECTLTMNERGEEQSWSFTVEPRINGVTSGGPAQGKLRAGDVLVSIDGIPITARAGGVRYANVEPGEEVELMVRRGGDLRQVVIRAGSVCPPPPPKPLAPAPTLPLAEVVAVDSVLAARDSLVGLPLPSRAVGRLAPPPPPDTLGPEPRRPRGIAVSPRVVVAPEGRAAGVAARAARGVASAGSTRGSLGLLAGASPTGRLGIGFQCKECGTRSAEESDQEVWFFSGPLEVTAVNSGGPADDAGIRRGDFIKAIDGKEIDTDEGGLAFSNITPGNPVRLTIVKRNGSEADVSLVPEEPTPLGRLVGRGAAEAGTGVAVTAPAPDRRPIPSASARAGVPGRVTPPEPVPELEPPAGMPLRFSGTVSGVEVEVRGEPVTVSELKDSRTLYINADGLWIKIRVPSALSRSRGGGTGSSSSFRR